MEIYYNTLNTTISKEEKEKYAQAYYGAMSTISNDPSIVNNIENEIILEMRKDLGTEK